MSGHCQKQEELRREVNAILDRIDNLNGQQIEALKSGDDKRLMALDKDLELTFGQKERALASCFSTTTSTGAEVNPQSAGSASDSRGVRQPAALIPPFVAEV